MNRLLKSVIVVTALLLAMPAAAQVKIGVKGGVNMSRLKFSGSNRLGFCIGPSLRLKVPLIGIDVAALYEQRDVKLYNETFSMKSIIVPVNLRFHLAVVYLSLGPQFGFNVGKNSYDWMEREGYNSSYKLKGTNLSGNLGAGFHLGDNIEVGLAYNIPLGKMADVSWRNAYEHVIKNYDDDPRAKSWVITAAYYF